MAIKTQGTGVSNATYDLVSILYHSLQAIETGQRYLDDMKGDTRQRAFVEHFIASNRTCADECKAVLLHALQNEKPQGKPHH